MTTEEVIDGLLEIRQNYDDAESLAVIDELIDARRNGIEGKAFLEMMKLGGKKLRKISRGNFAVRLGKSIKEILTDPVFIAQQAIVIVYVIIKELL